MIDSRSDLPKTGVARFRVNSIVRENPYIEADISPFPEHTLSGCFIEAGTLLDCTLC